MIETHLNIFDCVVIGIMAISCLIAFFRGLVKEILSLVAWIGAGIVTFAYFKPAAEFMRAYFKSEAVASAAAAIGLYIGALVCFAIINMVIIKTIRQGGESGMLDNLLGLIFGAFRGAFIISLGFFLITLVLPEKEYPAWIAESVTHPYAEKGAMILVRVAPEYMGKASSLQKKAVEEARQKLGEDEYGGGEGYSRENQRHMDRLLESTGERP
jgi:membrane protein required for colicin V production